VRRYGGGKEGRELPFPKELPCRALIQNSGNSVCLCIN